MTFPQKLKSIRNKLGLSQEQLADKLGVSRQAVTKWESGEGMPDTFNLKALASLSGHTMDYLLDSNSNDAQQITFVEAVRETFMRFSDFEGRTTKPVFWWYALFYILVLAVCSVFDFVQLAENITLAYVLASVFAIVTLVPSIAVGVRRLHDSGENWKSMLWLLVPVFGLAYLCVLWLRPRAH